MIWTAHINSFLLSMASPMLHKMISGNFREGMSLQLSLEDIDAETFEQVLNLWCWKEGHAGSSKMSW